MLTRNPKAMISQARKTWQTWQSRDQGREH